MDYNTIAYKVENGVIVNASIVDASSELEEGFVRRPYPLGIGFKESFGDFYPDGFTQESIDNSRTALAERCTYDLSMYGNMLEDIVANFPEQTPEGDLIEVALEIIEQKKKLQNYVAYLNELNDTINNLQNPVQYQYKLFGEV